MLMTMQLWGAPVGKVTYLPRIDETFTEAIEPINPWLANIKIVMIPKDKTCTDAQHAGGAEVDSLSCYRTMSNQKLVTTPALVDAWRAQSPRIEQYLRDNGWHQKGEVSGQRLSNLLDVLDGPTLRSTEYEKSYGSVHCLVSFWYDASEPIDKRFNIGEDCAQSIFDT